VVLAAAGEGACAAGGDLPLAAAACICDRPNRAGDCCSSSCC
jgi:hypothetical protein